MAISQLSLTDFRNLKSTTLDFDRRLNLITGDNGSGKTSLLEAVHVLCQGQSFRTAQLKECIRHDASGFLLFGRFERFKIGLAKSVRKVEIRVDGKVIHRRSDLVRKSPVNVVNADSFELINGAPARRRAFLDWCLFHVEPSYANDWRRYQHSLKQRNRLLKTRKDLNLLEYWDRDLFESSVKLGDMRRIYTIRLHDIVQEHYRELLTGIPLEIGYQQGWEEQETLLQCLANSRERDIRSGYTGVGVHRDDISMTTSNRKVGEVLSRGQSKRVCLALFMAVLKMVNDACGSTVVLLIDDLHSELDKKAQELVYREFAGMKIQLFISNIDNSVPAGIGAKEYKMFHVEHGIIKPRNFS
ncbi:MAG: DNA replication/repair protein RecF [Gammaproteobacteria bacterium]|nr:DNA replication/repair protein RecF [Gammaproteobacteria bacterium]MDH3447177.1 DNA replication/repair protein RecF [Gammaproteobacteria bacterium]